MKEIERVAAHLAQIGALAAQDEVGLRVPAVSGWSVAQQLDHALKVAEFALARVVAAGEPLPRGINPLGRLLLAIGRIPRGRGKSPQAALGEERSPAELAAAVARVRSLVAELRERPELLAARAPLVKHPYFGGLSPAQALRMVAIHTDHHLRIVADIRRAAAKQQLH